MSVNSDNMADGRTARRRLIRGVFSAPAVLTLYSGNTFAQASMSCVAKQVAAIPPALPEPSGGPDTWVRVQLWTLGAAGTGGSRWVKGEDVVALKSGTGTVHLTSVQWQCFSAGNANGNTSGYTMGQVLDSTPTKGIKTPAKNGQWVALRVDASGNIVGVVGLNGSSNTSAVAGTCWDSFRGLALN